MGAIPSLARVSLLPIEGCDLGTAALSGSGLGADEN